MPVNTDVMVKLRTRDVLHSFWLPNARLKQDLLPGKTIPQWFNLTETGKYEIICAELCGMSHTMMRADLIVESREEYDAWLDRQIEEFGEFDVDDDPTGMWKHWRDK